MPSIKSRPVVSMLLVSIVVIAGHLLPGFDKSAIGDSIRNSLHLVVFAVLALIMFESLELSGSTVVTSVITIVIAVGVIGSLSEFLQFAAGRRPDVFDVARDVTGAVTALAGRLAWRWSGKNTISRFVKSLGRPASVLIGASVVSPLLFWISIIGLGRMSSPVILDFDQWWNKFVYQPMNADIVSTGVEAGSADVLLWKSRRSGLVISPVMSDWTRYRYLAITAGMAEGPGMEVGIRLNDSVRKGPWSSQVLASIAADTGAETIRIPLRDLVGKGGKVSLNLGDIQELLIIARHQGGDRVMHIDDIRLE